MLYQKNLKLYQQQMHVIELPDLRSKTILLLSDKRSANFHVRDTVVYTSHDDIRFLFSLGVPLGVKENT